MSVPRDHDVRRFHNRRHVERVEPKLAAYAAEVTARVKHTLGRDLVGLWLFGSAALGDYDSARSDVDIQAVARCRLPRPELSALAAALSHRVLACPARGLEFVLYPADGLHVAEGPEFQLNLNTGARIREHVAFDAKEDSRFWFVIDVAIGRARGITLVGRPPDEVFPDPPAQLLLSALADALAWFSANEGASAQTVLSACRAWAYAVGGVWLSKAESARWARDQLPGNGLIDRAVDLRVGPLDPAPVAALVRRVECVIERHRAALERPFV